MSQVLQELVDLLSLEKIEVGLYRGDSQNLGFGRVFGGQVIGQALAAANQTVEANRPVHSFHSYFLLPGDSSKPIVYDVENVRDGGSISTRLVDRRLVSAVHNFPEVAIQVLDKDKFGDPSRRVCHYFFTFFDVIQLQIFGFFGLRCFVFDWIFGRKLNGFAAR